MCDTVVCRSSLPLKARSTEAKIRLLRVGNLREFLASSFCYLNGDMSAVCMSYVHVVNPSWFQHEACVVANTTSCSSSVATVSKSKIVTNLTFMTVQRALRRALSLPCCQSIQTADGEVRDCPCWGKEGALTREHLNKGLSLIHI